MRDETRGVISILTRIDWFSKCGEKATDSEYAFVDSKERAIQMFTSRQWFYFANPIRNREGSFVVPTFNRVEEYNAVAMEVCGVATEEIVRRIDPKIGAHLDLRNETRRSVQMDIAHILWEAEFEHLVTPMFYLPIILPAYRLGRLPCGWTGREPDDDWNGNSPKDIPPGKLVLY